MILIIDLNEKKDGLGFDEFVKPLERAVKECSAAPGIKSTAAKDAKDSKGIKKAQFLSKHYLEVTPEDLKKAGKIILSGTPLKDFAFLEEQERFDWLRTINKPVLGICAGMQAICVVFGGKLSTVPEIGMVTVRTLKENPLFSGEFSAYCLHKNAAQPSADFVVLAESSKCIQAFRHKTLSLFGLMFHPEIRNQEIIEKFLKLK